MACMAIDKILDQGAEKLYQKYLNKRVKPHLASSVYSACQSLACASNMTKDREPSGEKYKELWGDEEEPAAAKRPEWITHALPIR